LILYIIESYKRKEKKRDIKCRIQKTKRRRERSTFLKKERSSFFRDQDLKNQVSGMILELKIGMHLRFMVLLLLE